MEELIQKVLTWLKVKLPIAVGVWFAGMIIAALVVDVILTKVILIALGWAGGRLANSMAEKKR